MLEEGRGGRHGYRNTQINSQEPRSSRPTCTCSGTYCRHLTSIEILPLHRGPVNHHQKLQVVAPSSRPGVREQGRRPHRFEQGPFSEGGSEPSPPRPTGTSGSYPPTASQSRSRPSRTSRSRTVAHSTHLRHPLEASGGRIIPPLGGPPTFLRLSGQGHLGRLAGRHNPGQRWRGKGLLRDPFPPEEIEGGSREVTSPPHTGAVNPSRR